MKARERLVARSGLKPLGIFFCCLSVLCVIAVRVTDSVVRGEETPKRAPITKTQATPRYDLIDRSGRKIATDRVLYKLSMSPNALWQGHTPGRIARRLHECLLPQNQEGERALLDRMLPGSVDGVIQVRLASLGGDGESGVEHFLTPAAVQRLDEWLIAGEGEGAAPVSGMWLQQAGAEGDYRLCWMPEVLLSESTREAQGFRRERGDGLGHTDRPAAWCRRIAARLAPCLGFGGLDSMSARKEVWSCLMPSRYQIVLPRLSNAEAWRVREMLEEEGISAGQVKLDSYRERTYPAAFSVSEASEPRATDLANAGWSFLGAWGHLNWEDSLSLVLRRHGLDPLDEDIRCAVRVAAQALATGDGKAQDVQLLALVEEVEAELLRHAPRSGLERRCAQLLEDEAYRDLLATPAEFYFMAHRPAHASSIPYFYGAVAEGEAPRVYTTIDAHLQRFLHDALVDANEEHDAALSMGIVIDVLSGDVLAIDGVSAYGQEMFLPLQFAFTPGSTFKPLIVAAALDAGVVTPEQRFSTNERATLVGDYVVGCTRRPIGEARNSRLGIDKTLSLREGLAYSINAVMVQVGLKMTNEQLHATLTRLGYGATEQTALGLTGAGRLTPLGEWSRCYTQPSVSFGHELQCTLWQHGAGLSTVIRGGERLPLRVLQGVVRGDEFRSVERGEPQVVYSNETCEELRGMMRMAARIGTGKRFYQGLEREGIALCFGCKTGTTEKEKGTSCTHIEHACAQENVRRVHEGLEKQNCTQAGRDSARPHAGKCYSASMMVFGSVGDPNGALPIAGTKREVMVLILIDEPRGDSYYGSQVAGPTAIAVLKEAHGLTRNGEPWEASAPAPQEVPEGLTELLSEDPVREIPGVLEGAGH